MIEQTPTEQGTLPMRVCPACGHIERSYPHNDGECPECEAALDNHPTHMLVPLVAYVSLDEIERLTQAIRAIQLVAHEGLWGNDDEMQAALELIERHCVIAAPSPAEEGATE